MPLTQKITTSAIEWTHVSKTSEQAMSELKKKYGFLEEDLRDVPPPLQRQKIVVRPDYVFLTLLFPIYNRETGQMKVSEADFFVNKKFIVTANEDDELFPLRNFFRECKKDKTLAEKFGSEGPSQMLCEILRRLQEHCFPMLVNMTNDVEAIEHRLFKEYEKHTIHEILRIKTNIADFRRTAWGDEEMMKKLLNKGKDFFPKNIAEKFKIVIEYAEEIWDLLETLRDSVNTLHQTNESLMSFRTNKIMKTLTIFSVIVIPLTLIASIFGMNAHLPLVDSPYGFWKIIALMMLGIGGMLSYFKWQKWI